MTRLRLAALLSICFLTFQPAQAADAFRYWSLWTSDNSQWVYAQLGAGSIEATDGLVVGWRFSTSTEGSGDTPRIAPSFDDICSGTPAADGQARVALVVDYGDASDYPGGETPPNPLSECVQVPSGSTVADAVSVNHEVRAEGGFVCGVDSLPLTGCAEKAVVAESGEDDLSRWVTIGLGTILLAATWRGLLIQKGWRNKE